MSLFSPLTGGFKLLTFKAKAALAGMLLALIVASNLTTGIVYYNKGLNQSKVAIADYEKKRAELQAEVNELQGKINTGTVVKYITVTNTIERLVDSNGRIISSRTATRPDSVNGINNTLPRGAVYSHDQAARGLAIDPKQAGNSSPSGIGDKPLLSTVNSNYGTCLQTAAQLKALQEWVAESKKVHEETKMKSKKRGID